MLQKKILVCDDDPDILDVTRMLLEAENFKVITQSNSTRLISQALDEHPDLMLIDCGCLIYLEINSQKKYDKYRL